MEDYATLIRDRTPIRALRLPLTTGDPHTVADRIIGLGSRVCAVFVLGLGHTDAASVQREVEEGGGPLVITELDVLTVPLAAATITVLRRRSVPPRAGRVVITNPQWAPLLAPVLITSGVGDLSSWHERDAEAFPLRRLMEHNDVLVDLAGCAPETAAPGRTVVVPPDLYAYDALVLPGLLSALCGHGVRRLTVEVVAACVRALALITPADQMLPSLDDRLLVSAVARHASRTIGHAPPFSNQHQ
ncbi:NADP-dependent malic enzyme (plasmid) [Rhodococcus sp. WAY2]|nr:NADP-dependent malic enzyme [Rhodococcus sp. WAY2]